MVMQGRSRRVALTTLVTLLGLVLFGGMAIPPPAPSTPAGTSHPLDEPLRLLGRAQQAFAGVRDYSCTMIKQERINGALSPVHVITAMIRNQPFSVYMRWHQPRACVGQEVCYVAGKNNGQMRAKSSGLLGTVGFVSIDPDDPRAKKTSNHSVTEAGLGNLMRRYEERWTAERQFNRVAVKVGEYEYNKRRCQRVEVTYTERVPSSTYYRGVIYFDKEIALPIRVELYGWPRNGGAPGGDLIETYSYVNLKLNPGLPDSTFNK
jgi:hypothetical protein